MATLENWSESGLLSNLHEVVRDCSLIGRALAGGWVTPERRAHLLEKIHGMAMRLADGDEHAKPVKALGQLLEAAYQFDVRLTERQEKALRLREPQQPGQAKGDVTLIIPKAVGQLREGATVESGKRQLLERIERLRLSRGVGGDAGRHTGDLGTARGS